ncbi:hypothetical protein MNBD_CHLOROFLEXI01-4704 [hydrothermal vent metagenome]|uniref:Effector-associated domain-containing protein n=2 Tax=hydrothermal vent metagenome TaxID=652676 RepID=A0A3B0UWF3_9ZZZZ
MSNIYTPEYFVNQEPKFLGFQKLLRPETRQAVMLIQATKDMGKTWLAGRMQHHCQEPTVNLPAAYVDFRNPKQDHHDFLGLVRLIRQQLNQPAYFNQLNEIINAYSDVPSTAVSGLGLLRQNIVNSFNLDEIRGLCLDININYEELTGEALSARAGSLVAYCQRRRLLTALISRCAELRVRVDWWDGLAAYRLGTAVADQPTNDAISEDNMGILHTDSAADQSRVERQINDAFFDTLATLVADHAPIVLLFDSYEKIKPTADQWLRQELLARLRDEQISELIIIISGRQTPDLSDLNMSRLLVQTQLKPFDEAIVREYFEERRKLVIDGLDWRTIVLTSGGVPGALAMMADHTMATESSDDDFFNDL